MYNYEAIPMGFETGLESTNQRVYQKIMKQSLWDLKQEQHRNCWNKMQGL